MVFLMTAFRLREVYRKKSRLMRVFRSMAAFRLRPPYRSMAQMGCRYGESMVWLRRNLVVLKRLVAMRILPHAVDAG